MPLIKVCLICKPGRCVPSVKQEHVWQPERPLQGQKQPGPMLKVANGLWQLSSTSCSCFMLGLWLLLYTNIVDDHGTVHVMQKRDTKQDELFARHHAWQICCLHFHVLCTCTCLHLEMLLGTLQMGPCRPCDLISRGRCKAICGRSRIPELCCCLSRTAWPACSYG